MKTENLIWAFGLLCLFLSLPASALDFIVNSQADVPDEFPGNGQCSPVGGVGNTCTLRAAIMEANQHPGPHLILIASGTYNLSNTGADEDLAVTGDLDIHRQITIANFTNTPPLVFGHSTDRVFDIHPGGSLHLINLNIAGGVANSASTRHGGAFRVAAGASLHLEQALVSSNIGNIGGAIYSDGIVLIEDSEFVNNVVTDDHTMTANANGAAILNRGQLGINRSTFRNNGVIPGGTGFLTTEYAVHSKQGFVADPWVQIQNSTFYENTNGVFSEGVTTAITNATFVNNNHRGIRFLPNLNALGEVQLRIVRTVLYGHTGDCNGLPDDQPEFDVAGRINASSDESCGFTGDFDFQNISNPFLPEPGLWGGKTHSYMPRSNGILIDPPGSTCGFLASLEDQRGEPRPVDANGIGVARCDIGALEFQPGMDPVLGDSLFSDRFQQGG